MNSDWIKIYQELGSISSVAHRYGISEHKASLQISLAALQQNNMADAIQFMQQATKMAPHIALYRRNLGELLRRAKQLEAAIASHKIAISIEPHSAENHFLLGLAYNDDRQFKVAIQHYHTALSYDHNYGMAWNNLGSSLESCGEKCTAKLAYTTAVSLNPQHAEAQNNLGAIYSEEGQLDKAHAHFAAAIAAKPDFVNAHYNLSLIKTYTLDDPHLTLLESIIKKINDYPDSDRIHYYFALGKALDDSNQYERAFRAYAEGNRLHYLHKPWDKTKLNELIENLPKIFTQSFFKQTQVTKDTRCPIFIVGMPRSGTTLIEQILSSHENIYGAGELNILDEIIHESYHTTNRSSVLRKLGEGNYARSKDNELALQEAGFLQDGGYIPFSSWMAQLTDQECAVLGKKYLDRTWELAADKNFIIDKMPSNCFYLGMIYRMLPTAKIIHAIRDPMDSCFSCFTHLFKDNNMSFAYDLTALGNYYILYAKAMQHWRTVLPQNAIFDLPYEQMIAHHEALSKQVIEYIGLPWDPRCLNFYENTRIVQTASLTQVRKPIYKTSVQRWKYFARELKTLLQIVTPYRNIEGISS